jgi:hypothetical protein
VCVCVSFTSFPIRLSVSYQLYIACLYFKGVFVKIHSSKDGERRVSGVKAQEVRSGDVQAIS